jgi:uncharacterized membrane protein YgcG
MKKLTRTARFMIAFAAALSPVVANAQPVCPYPAKWVWRGYWSCEYPAPVYYAPPYFYPYYGYYGGYAGRAYPHGGGYFGGGHGGAGHGGGGHSGGGHGGHR